MISSGPLLRKYPNSIVMEASRSKQEYNTHHQLSPTGVLETETNLSFTSPDTDNLKRISMIALAGTSNPRGVSVVRLGVDTCINDGVHHPGDRSGILLDDSVHHSEEVLEEIHSRFHHMSKRVPCLPLTDSASELMEQDEEYEYEEITVNSEDVEDGKTSAITAETPKSTGEYTFETVSTDDINKADDTGCSDDEGSYASTCHDEKAGIAGDKWASTSQSADSSISGFTLIIHHQPPEQKIFKSRNGRFGKENEEDIVNSSHLSSSTYDWEYLMDSPSKWVEAFDEAPFKLQSKIDRKRKIDNDTQSVLDELGDRPSSKLKKKQGSPQQHHRSHST